MNQAPLPRLLTPAELAEYLSVSEDTLARHRSEGTGVNFIKVGGGVRYPIGEVEKYITSQLQLPSEAQKLVAAATHGLKEVSTAINARMKELADASKPEAEPDPYAVTLSHVGATPGENIQRINLCPATPVTTPAAPHILQGR